MSARQTGSAPRQRGGSQLHQILILILGGMFLGGGGESLEERVSDAVDDSDREQVAVELSKKIEHTQNQRVNEFVRWRAEFYDHLSDPNVGNAGVKNDLNALCSSLRRQEDELLDLRFELRGALTDAEWTSIFEDQ